MKRFTSAALVLGALMAIAPAGAFAQGFDRDRGDNRARVDNRERVNIVRVDRERGFERARVQREWREHARVRFDHCR